MQLSFEPIQLEQQDAYRLKLNQCSQIASDYSFINLWGWCEEYDLQWAWQDDLVWIKQMLPEQALWAPVGNWSKAAWPAVLADAKGTCDRIIRVPQALLDVWRDHGLAEIQASESLEHWDYLYNRQDLIDLKGNRYHKKKNLLNQFKKKYQWIYLPFGSEMIEMALAMQSDWCAWRDCENNDTLAAENRAIARVLKHWQVLDGITGGALRVEDTLVSYTIAEGLPDDSLVIHFEKGDPDYKGSYQAINQMFLEQSPQEGSLVNREQDLGDQGLRKAKLSYHPVDYVRKYQVMIGRK